MTYIAKMLLLSYFYTTILLLIEMKSTYVNGTTSIREVIQMYYVKYSKCRIIA